MQWLKQPMIRTATHGCPHHLDELVAIHLLRIAAQQRGAEIDVSFLDRASIAAGLDGFDVVVDIGMQFDPQRGRFDHHQGGPDVESRAAAGLVFDALFGDDPKYPYLEPMIRCVDRLDIGPATGEGTIQSEGMGMLTLSALLKATGGFRPDPARSSKCLEIIGPLVDHWFHHAEGYARAPDIIASGQAVGRGAFIASDEWYGPGMIQYLRTTPLAFVGFPANNRFQVVVVEEADRTPRLVLRQGLPGATFVHAKGFMAAFPDESTAASALAVL